MKPRAAGDGLHARIRRSGRIDEDGIELLGIECCQQIGAFFERHVRDDGSVQACCARLAREPVEAALQRYVVVRHEHERDGILARERCGELEAAIHGCAGSECALIGVQDHRAIGDGLREWNLQLHQVDAGFDHLLHDAAAGIEARIAEHDVTHEQDVAPRFALVDFSREHDTPPPCR